MQVKIESEQYVQTDNANIEVEEPKKVHLIIHCPGYSNAINSSSSLGDGFKYSAEALKKKKEKEPTFDYSKETIIVIYVSSTKRFLEAIESQELFSIIDLTVFSHGYMRTNAGISLGGEKEGEKRPDGTFVTLQEQNDQVSNYDLREINRNNYTMINPDKFDINATVTLYGCYLGGAVSVTDEYIEKHAFAPYLAQWLLIPVYAFTGSGLFKTKEKTMNGKTQIFDGTMIRAEDVHTQRVRLSAFKPNEKPIIIRK